MKIRGIISCVALIAFFAGCSFQSRITTTPAAGVEKIPTIIAVYPILANQTAFRPIFLNKEAIRLSEREDRVYIVPAAESELVVTAHSEIFTGLISSELSHYGFKLKVLPLEVFKDDDAGSGGSGTFVVSLGTIRDLRENYGLEAILLGNVFFVHDPYDPPEPSVRSFYLKVVDAKTLDVLCHVSNDYGDLGEEIEDAAKDIGFELAKFANLAVEKEDDKPYTQIKSD